MPGQGAARPLRSAEAEPLPRGSGASSPRFFLLSPRGRLQGEAVQQAVATGQHHIAVGAMKLP